MANILILDDEYANRLLLTTVLRHAGHRVLEAATGAEAVRIAGERRLDLLLVDLSLPGMSGAEVIRAVRSQSATVGMRIALYTGTPVDAALRDFMERNAIAHVVPKPSDPHALLRAVEAALHG
ncbi:MAG: response regulator [Candidatus Tumulicola sp.]